MEQRQSGVGVGDGLGEGDDATGVGVLIVGLVTGVATVFCTGTTFSTGFGSGCCATFSTIFGGSGGTSLGGSGSGGLISCRMTNSTGSVEGLTISFAKACH